MDFDEFYHTQWMEHVEDSGGIKATLKLLIALVGTLILAQITTIGFLMKLLAE